MRITNVLLKQHRGWLMKLKWRIQGKRSLIETGAQKSLEANNIVVKDAAVLFGMEGTGRKPFVPIIGYNPPNSEDIKPPSTKLTFGDTDVLVYGCSQAQALTNTTQFNAFPTEIEKKISSIKVPTAIERSMNQSVLVSHLLDAEQVKHYERFPVAPDKPKHLKPRHYTISDERKNSLVANRLINHCERYYGLGSKHKILHDLQFMLPLQFNDKTVQFDIKTEFFIGSNKPINKFKAIEDSTKFPSIAPLEPTISLKEIDNDTKLKFYYPIQAPSLHPHIIMLDYSKGYVKNLYEKPVSDSQFEARALLKAFTVTASWAKKLYGENVTTFDKPVVLQVMQLDGKRIQFGIFQLNTLDLNNENENRNFWFRKPIMHLYDECTYNQGRPMLSNYNFDVLKTFCVLYGN